MSIQKTRRDLIDSIHLLNDEVDVDIVQGGKHQRITLTYQGKSRFATASVTCSDRRGPPRLLRDIKNELRNLGAIS